MAPDGSVLSSRLIAWAAPRFAGQPRLLALVYLGLALAFFLPVMVAVWMGHTLIVGQLKDVAVERAAYVLQRAHSISAQFANADAELGAIGGEQPCGPRHVRKMRQLAVRMNLLVGVGYVEKNSLQCSSFGLEAIDVGEPSYLSGRGYSVRTSLPPKFDGSADLILTTNKATGYTAIIHKSTLLDSMPLGILTSTGLLGIKSKEAITQVGVFDARWFQRIPAASTGAALLGGDLVVWSMSEKFDYLSYAVVSKAVITQRFERTLLLLIPGGLLVGMLFAGGALLLARMQSSLPALIKAGLRNGEFHLLYQPIVDLRDGCWVGAEALLRWRRITGELVSPDIFIPVAEKSDLMGKMTLRVLELVERAAPALCAKDKDFFISINFSAQDFSNPQLLEKTRALIANSSLAPHNFHIEATERVFLDPKAAQAGISALRTMGVEVAIDDFGTGFSGLAYLTDVRIDCLKIDKCFVQTIGKESVTSSVVGHIIELAKSLDMSMIAEGVETTEQAQYLQQHGVRMAQGWLYGKPMPLLELAGRLRSTV